MDEKLRWFAKTKLKDLREQKGYSQKKTADLLSLTYGEEISEAQYQKWEQGERGLNPTQVLHLAAFFSVDYKEIVKRKNLK